VRVLRLAVLTVLLALAVGCAGDSDEELLSETGFKDRVRAAIVTGTEYEAAVGSEFEVRVTEARGPARVDVALGTAYGRYRADPDGEAQIIAGVVREAGNRMRRGLADQEFDQGRRALRPLLRRGVDVRGYPREPLQKRFLADLVVLYAVETEDQLALVRPADAERWGQPLPELDRLALANLFRQTQRSEKLLCEPGEQGKLCGWASGDGYDGARMLVRELRRQIVRELGGPAVYAVPRDDVFVALPQGLAERIRQQVLRDFTAAENPVSPELFVEQDGELVVLD
jgi:hypothetical protein